MRLFSHILIVILYYILNIQKILELEDLPDVSKKDKTSVLYDLYVKENLGSESSILIKFYRTSKWLFQLLFLSPLYIYIYIFLVLSLPLSPPLIYSPPSNTIIHSLLNLIQVDTWRCIWGVYSSMYSTCSASSIVRNLILLIS